MNPVRNLDGDGYIDHPDHFASGDALHVMGRTHPDHFVDVTDHIETAVTRSRGQDAAGRTASPA